MLGSATRKALVLALGCCAIAAVGASTASAAPPANDPFAAPTNLAATTSNTVAGTTAESTLEPPNEPNHIGSGGSVWYTWTAPGHRDGELQHVRHRSSTTSSASTPGPP